MCCEKPNYFCYPCSHEISSLRGYRQHMSTHIYDADIFYCPKANCNFLTGRKKYLFAHFTKHENEKELKRYTDRTEYIQQITLRTHYVIRKFHQKYNYTNPLKNSICFTCLKYPKNLNRHKCVRHKLNLNYCSECDSFVESKNFLDHIQKNCKLRTIFHFTDIYTSKKYIDEKENKNN